MSYIHLNFCRKLADLRLSELDSTEGNSEIDKIEFEHVSFNLQINDNLCINASSKALCGVVGQEEFMLFIKSLVTMSTRLQRAHFYVYFLVISRIHCIFVLHLLVFTLQVFPF